jgi:hypothetical protein
MILELVLGCWRVTPERIIHKGGTSIPTRSQIDPWIGILEK